MTNLRYEVADGIATLTIDRPEARNALDAGLLRDLVAAFDAVDADDGVHVAVLTGADPVFCAGLDLKELEPGGTLDMSSLTQAGNPWPSRVKPMIGAVNGAAVTGGLELALQCDILVASEHARFGDTHARVGIMPFWGLSTALPRAVGLRTATLMSLTGNFLSAEDAWRLGMVAAVVPHGELLSTARRLAQDIVSNDQPAVRAMLAAYRETAALDGAAAEAAELRRALDWQGEGFDAAELARRREAVTRRGRAQR